MIAPKDDKIGVHKRVGARAENVWEGEGDFVYHTPMSGVSKTKEGRRRFLSPSQRVPISFFFSAEGRHDALCSTLHDFLFEIRDRSIRLSVRAGEVSEEETRRRRFTFGQALPYTPKTSLPLKAFLLLYPLASFSGSMIRTWGMRDEHECAAGRGCVGRKIRWVYKGYISMLAPAVRKVSVTGGD